MWIVEIDQGGINWTPIAYCHSKEQAEAQASHIPQGKPVRVREYGKPAAQTSVIQIKEPDPS